ncbi:MAG: beta-phosphoglucomutase family hydrolase [Patescibacteria group bacterium]
MIKAVIFDMDGVIADSIPVHLKAWQRVYKEKFNIILTPKFFFKHLNGRQGPDSIMIVTKQNIPFSERLKITQLKDQYSHQILKRSLKPMAGLIHFLKWLKKNKIKTAIATSAQPKTKDLFIKKLKLKKYFDFVIDASSIKHGKPHPDCFLQAVRGLKVLPSQAVVIEDALLGIKAGKAGKFNQVVGITSSQPERELYEANVIIKDFNDKKLFNLIKPEIILASKSRARKKLLKKQIENFKVKASYINERQIKIQEPKKLVLKLAELKAKKISKQNPMTLVIGADTVGAIKNKIYGKPKTKKNYFNFVREHSKNKLAVITGWWIIDGVNNKKYSGVETSWVYFNGITKDMAENYYKKYNPLEKGGGFNIEEIEKLGFVKKITGDYDNIVGLPQKAVKKLLDICAEERT